MEILSLKLAYFSPTGTTRTIVQAVAHGINQNIDIIKSSMITLLKCYKNKRR